MKFFKKFVTSALVIAMISSFSTAVFAANLTDEAEFYTFKADIVEDTVKVGDTVTVNVLLSSKDGSDLDFSYTGEWGTDGASVMLGFQYDSDILTYAGVQTATGFSEVTGETLEKGKLVQVFSFADNINFKSGSTFVTYKFTVNDVADGTYSDAILIDSGNCSISDDYLAYELWTSSGVINTSADALVVKSAPAGPTATAGTTTTDGKITEYTFEGTDAIEKVLLFNEKVAGSAITEATRFKVTSGTRSQIFGGDIWAKLGAEGDGEVSVENVVFGLIVTAANNAADFTFEIVK